MQTVAGLAKSLGLPPSSVIDQCQRLGIDAKWAGAELSVADVDLLQVIAGGAAQVKGLATARAPLFGQGDVFFPAQVFGREGAAGVKDILRFAGGDHFTAEAAGAGA